MVDMPSVCQQRPAEPGVPGRAGGGSADLARNIRPEMLARVSGYDALGSMMATPAGALVAGPAATAFLCGRRSTARRR